MSTLKQTKLDNFIKTTLWRTQLHSSGNIIYYNKQTRKSQWDEPPEIAFFRQKLEAPPTIINLLICAHGRLIGSIDTLEKLIKEPLFVKINLAMLDEINACINLSPEFIESEILTVADSVFSVSKSLFVPSLIHKVQEENQKMIQEQNDTALRLNEQLAIIRIEEPDYGEENKLYSTTPNFEMYADVKSLLDKRFSWTSDYREVLPFEIYTENQELKIDILKTIYGVNDMSHITFKYVLQKNEREIGPTLFDIIEIIKTKCIEKGIINVEINIIDLSCNSNNHSENGKIIMDSDTHELNVYAIENTGGKKQKKTIKRRTTRKIKRKIKRTIKNNKKNNKKKKRKF